MSECATLRKLYRSYFSLYKPCLVPTLGNTTGTTKSARTAPST